MLHEAFQLSLHECLEFDNDLTTMFFLCQPDAPDRNVNMSELGDLDIDCDEQGPHETPNGAHAHKDG